MYLGLVVRSLKLVTFPLLQSLFFNTNQLSLQVVALDRLLVTLTSVPTRKQHGANDIIVNVWCMIVQVASCCLGT